MAQPASKVSPDGPKEAKNGPAGLKSEHGWTKMGTWGVPLCTLMHFYQVSVNTYAFLMNIHGKPTKIQQIAVKIMNIAQKHKVDPFWSIRAHF